MHNEKRLKAFLENPLKRHEKHDELDREHTRIKDERKELVLAGYRQKQE